MPEKQLPLQPVLVMMGVSGPGKSTVAGVLAGRLGWDLEEGDDLHPAANVAKMTSGQPRTDDDRWPWLDAVASWIREHTLAGKPGISPVRPSNTSIATSCAATTLSSSTSLEPRKNWAVASSADMTLSRPRHC